MTLAEALDIPQSSPKVIWEALDVAIGHLTKVVEGNGD